MVLVLVLRAWRSWIGLHRLLRLRRQTVFATEWLWRRLLTRV